MLTLKSQDVISETLQAVKGYWNLTPRPPLQYGEGVTVGDGGRKMLHLAKVLQVTPSPPPPAAE